MNKKQVLLGSALMCGALMALGATPASAKAITTKLYYSYSNPGYNSSKTANSTTNSKYFGEDFSCVKPDGTLAYGCSTTATGQAKSPYTGYNPPTLLPKLSTSSSFTFTSTSKGKWPQAGLTGANQQTFLEIDPISCMKGGSGTGLGCSNTGTTSGIEKNDITTSLFFSESTGSGAKGITINVSALASFNYANETDSFCWDASKLTSSATLAGATVVENKQVAGKYSCTPGGLPNNVDVNTAPLSDFGFEEIIFNLGSDFFEVNLYNWFDWNMTPQITFTQIDPTTVPEPASVTLLGAGLLGLGAFARRRKKAA